jgi:hypothetical protein
MQKVGIVNHLLTYFRFYQKIILNITCDTFKPVSLAGLQAVNFINSI